MIYPDRPQLPPTQTGGARVVGNLSIWLLLATASDVESAEMKPKTPPSCFLYNCRYLKTGLMPLCVSDLQLSMRPMPVVPRISVLNLWLSCLQILRVSFSDGRATLVVQICIWSKLRRLRWPLCKVLVKCLVVDRLLLLCIRYVILAVF